MFKTIIVGTDGSSQAARALEVARALASEDSARLVLVHAIELVGGKGGVYPLAADEDDIEKRIKTQVEVLQEKGIAAESVIEQVRLGGPAHVIADVAATLDADLIVVGTTGRSPVTEVLLGSVPVRLLHIAHRPVLVVPAPATA